MHHDPRCTYPATGATCTCAPSTAHTVPGVGRISRSRADRTVPVLPGPGDWCISADALAALAWADTAWVAAYVGDRDLAAMCGLPLCYCEDCVGVAAT